MFSQSFSHTDELIDLTCLGFFTPINQFIIRLSIDAKVAIIATQTVLLRASVSLSKAVL